MTRLLLDTHVLLWSFTDDRRLGKSVREMVLDPAGDVYASAASAWELSIEAGLGRPPHHHTDPFDRMLIAQALVEGLSIVTADAVFSRYYAKVIAAA